MLKIFIADDSKVIKQQLKETLAELGNIDVVGAAEDAEQAIPEIQRLKPDVVILDIRMPGGGGMPVLKNIKSNQPDTVTIVLTFDPYPSYREEYMRAGANYFFDKARDTQQMIALLVQLAQRRTGAPDERPPTDSLKTNPTIYNG